MSLKSSVARSMVGVEPSLPGIGLLRTHSISMARLHLLS